MVEVAVVVDQEGLPLYWHLPPGRSALAIPDSRDLWDILWRYRERLGGVAHSHPGGGIPVPSKEDLTTFAACEAGLGRRLDWWILTRDHVRCFAWEGPGRLDYAPCRRTDEVPAWVEGLRLRSFGRRPVAQRRAS